MAERLRLFGWLSATALGAWLAWELTRTPAAPPLPPAGAAESGSFELPDLEVEPPELLALRATLERPLFDDDRRPDESEEQVDIGPDQPLPSSDSSLVLSAVIVDADGSRSALLQVPGEPQSRRLMEGEEIAGWRLEAIHDDGVLLTGGERRNELPLRVYEPPRPPRPIRQQPPRRLPANLRPRLPMPPLEDQDTADQQPELEPPEETQDGNELNEPNEPTSRRAARE